MRFQDHSNLAGTHAFLSASKHHWINYTEEKLLETYNSHRAHVRGSQLHDLAAQMIRLGVKPQRTQQTFNMYVNDCIGWKMSPEVVLFYSQFAYGSADAIGFTEKNKHKILRISDLKTGVTPTKFDQLEVYGALFCLEYGYKPFELNFELRIYQSDEVRFVEGDQDKITHIVDKFVTFDKILKRRRMEEA